MEPIKEIREIEEGYTAMNKLAKIEDMNNIFFCSSFSSLFAQKLELASQSKDMKDQYAPAMLYWLRLIKSGQLRFANFAPHVKEKCHFYFLIH